jgi:hypothetical protein
MASYLLALLALGMVLLERKAWPAVRAAGGMALGLGLAAFYIVPAVYEQRWIEIERATAPGMRVADSFLFTRTGESYHDGILRTASWIVLFEVAVAALAAWQAWRGKAAALEAAHPSTGSESTASRKNGYLLLTASLPLILFLQLRVSAAIWNHAPWLRFLQFPWRWLLVLSMAACMLIALAVDATQRRAARQRRKKVAWWQAAAASLVFVSLVMGGALSFFQPCDEEDAVAAQVAAFHEDPGAPGIEGTDEYTPRGADNSRIQRTLPMVRVLASAQDDAADTAETANPAWKPKPTGSVSAQAAVKQEGAERWTIEIESSAPGYAVLRLMDYPAWRVTRNGQSVGDRPHRDDGLMTIPVAAGSNEINIRWSNAGHEMTGRAISAIALALLASAGFIEGRRRRRRLDPPRHQVS